MNEKKKINIDSATLNYLYHKYKDFLLPIGIIIACLLLFVLVIIPQFQSMLDSQQQAKAEASKLEVLRNNLNLLTNLDQAQLDSQLQVASSALPPGKNFFGILTGISTAANNAGVTLGDYSFQVGNITNPASGGIASFPSLEVDLTVNGGTKGVTEFMAQLYKTVPLSEVTNIVLSNVSSQLTVLFYYRPFPPLGFNDSAPVQVVSPTGLSTLTNLSSWNNLSNQPQAPSQPAPSSSSSAGTTSPF
ncbi:MAG: hypothetical protein M1277_00985 [Patescibacteria group bacterium]|nr:hypothetical protein [Patescibacteria group bacterium]